MTVSEHSPEYVRLREFLTEVMKPNSPYQPAMIAALLRSGSASVQSIAEAFHRYSSERSVQDYEAKPASLKGIAARTLIEQHGIVVRSEDGFCLALSYNPAKMTTAERSELVSICDGKARGWKLRKRADGRDRWVQVG